MPFINSKITLSVTPEKKDTIKSELGKAISLLHKSETYLMVGMEDNYDLYMAGKKLEKEPTLRSVCLAMRHPLITTR